jgi:amidase
VRDTAALLDCVSGRVPGDPFEIAEPDVPYIMRIDQDLRPLRVAVSTQPWSGLPADPELGGAARGLATILEDAGCRVELRSPAFDWHDFARAELHITSVLHAAFLDAVAASTNRQISATTVEAHSYRVYQLGRALGPGALFDAFDAGDRVCRSLGQFFEDVDLLITPTMPVLPALLGTFDGGIDDSPETIQDLWARHDTYTAPFNLTGQPAISVPYAVSRAGTPIGVQLVAGFGREDLLLTASRLIEREAGWATRIPPLHVSRHNEPVSTASRVRATGS